MVLPRPTKQKHSMSKAHSSCTVRAQALGWTLRSQRWIKRKQFWDGHSIGRAEDTHALVLRRSGAYPWVVENGSQEKGQTHTWSTVSKEHRPWGKTQAQITQSHWVQRASSLAVCWLCCPCPLHDFVWVSLSSASSFLWMFRSLQATVLSVGCFCRTLTPQEAKQTHLIKHPSARKATQAAASVGKTIPSIKSQLKSWYLSLCAYVYTCTFSWGMWIWEGWHIHVCVRARVRVRVEARGQPTCHSLGTTCLVSWDRILLALSLPSRLTWLASEAPPASPASLDMSSGDQSLRSRCQELQWLRHLPCLWLTFYFTSSPGIS